jgi:hypothetical protein
MGKLEKEFETLLTHFPNFISRELREMPEGDWGEVNVYIRQGQLPECRGRIDLAFVTDTAVYLVELKRDVITEPALGQLLRYYEPVKQRYPLHRILGFVVGNRCPDQESLERKLGMDPIKILTFRRDIPWWTQVVRCRGCEAGASSSDDICPYCGEPLF